MPDLPRYFFHSQVPPLVGEADSLNLDARAQETSKKVPCEWSFRDGHRSFQITRRSVATFDACTGFGLASLVSPLALCKSRDACGEPLVLMFRRWKPVPWTRQGIDRLDPRARSIHTDQHPAAVVPFYVDGVMRGGSGLWVLDS